MLTSPNSSAKATTLRRVKALLVLLWPLVVFAAVVFSASSFQSRLGTPRESQIAHPSGNGPESMVVDKQSSSSVSAATSVTTYIVTGTY